MYIEFIDLLRCTEAHEESQLVAVLNRVDGRNVIEARLGCPVCGAVFFIRDGTAVFDEAVVVPPPVLRDDSDAMRISAFLDLTSPGKIVLIAGDLASVSPSVAESSGARVISLNAPSPVQAVDTVGEILADSKFPLASKSLDGIALDESHSTTELFGEAARLLRPGGRIYLKSRAALPPQFRELAGGHDEQVAELVGDLVNLKPRR